jgi:hypothetical protein
MLIGTAALGSQYTAYYGTSTSTSSHSYTFTATSTTTYLSPQLQGTSGACEVFYDNVSLVLGADADRSVNNNGLQVNGTITKTAVATGADLVAYSGFSGANYLEQPYNADLNFGTGDFSISGWFKGGGSSQSPVITENVGSDANSSILIHSGGSGNYFFYTRTEGGAWYSLDSTVPWSNEWMYVHFVRTSTGKKTFMNGELTATDSVVSNIVGTSSPVLRVGNRPAHNGQIFTGSLALLRISATAPTAAQIKEIYDAEKPLFQENAKCTLNGTSDAVQCLAYDDSTSELVVGTSSSLSVFKGLRRVDEELGNFTEVSQQGGMRITEKA